ncbi:MAG: PIN domain nuclease [Bradymonadaceae bacterium]
MTAKYLADKGALARMPGPRVAKRLAPLIEAGEVATCAVVELEVRYSARSHADLLTMIRRRELAYAWVPISEQTLQRALEIQRLLAKTGHHRVPIPDLILAATAEEHDLVVLHYDKDFDTIAAVTGQETEWIVPRGELES